jgi:hypothetical protein
MEIANFFWEGELTELEKNCIKSFYNNGFKVKLWSYQDLKLDNVESCDASLVLPRGLDLKQEENGKTEKDASLASFSDYFRYKVVALFGGWWFDADCYCLRNVEEFTAIKEGRKIISCKQTDDINFLHHIGCGAFWVEEELSKQMIYDFEEIIHNLNGEVKTFGFFGPEFFTNFVKKYNRYDDILPVEAFYAIHWNESELMVYPENIHTAFERTKNSLLSHIWTTPFKEKNIDKNNPIEGSFLHALYRRQNLQEKLREVSRKLNALLKVGSNDEALVDEKRSIQEQLRNG